MELYKDYTYSEIEIFAEDNDYELENHGNNTVGSNFICLEHQHKDLTASFVLTSATNNNYIYTCIYTDI